MDPTSHNKTMDLLTCLEVPQPDRVIIAARNYIAAIGGNFDRLYLVGVTPKEERFGLRLARIPAAEATVRIAGQDVVAVRREGDILNTSRSARKATYFPAGLDGPEPQLTGKIIPCEDILAI